MKSCRITFTLAAILGFAPAVHAEFEAPSHGPDLDALKNLDGEKDWTLWVRGYLGYNDNVQFIPDMATIAADNESFYLGLTAEGSYQLMQNGSWSAAAALRIDQTFHFDSSGGAAAPDNFDLTVFQPALALNYAEGGWYSRGSYSWRWEDASTPTIGLDTHILELMAGREWSDCLHTELAWTHGWEDYHSSPGATRDGDRDRISFSLIHPGSDGTPRMLLRYTYTHNDADSRFFTYSGHELMFRSEHGLADRLGLAFEFGYEERDYASGASARSKQDIFKAGIQLAYAIDDHWTADLYYNYLDVDSNAAFFRGSRNNVGAGLRYDF
ncbi:MAG: hypothetical protein ABJZ54_16920 [Luteolibacter sp.]